MPSRVSPRRLAIYTSALVAISSAVSHAHSSSGRHLTLQHERCSLPRDENGVFILPKFPNIKSRKEQIAELRRHGPRTSSQSSHSITEESYDLLVIGGGATGCGIALDAATRGLKVALVERDDFSSGTSSRSTKLVHGGVRYLEKAAWNLDYGQYSLVREALQARSGFLQSAPHLTSWLPVMIPIQQWWQVPYFWIGMKCYDLLAGPQGNPSSYFLPRWKALETFPTLRQDLIGGLVYFDGQQNDSRMNVSLALTAALYGATTVNHLEVTKLEKDANGRICGVRVRDQLSDGDKETGPQGNEFIVHARGVINATGPFTDAIQQMDEPKARKIIAPSSGIHITLPAHFTPRKMGLLGPSTMDGRVLFMLPWQGTVIAGTTDTPCSLSNTPLATENEINWILKELKRNLNPQLNLERQDVLAAWSGIRPLVIDLDAKNTESIIRSHHVGISPSGLLTCAGGKWTTYRQMAEETVDKAIEEFNLETRQLKPFPNINGLPDTVQDLDSFNGSCQTHHLRIIGAHGYSTTLHIDLIQHFGLASDIAMHLARSYGDRAWEVATLSQLNHDSNINQRLTPQYPFIEAEIRYAVRREYAQTATDVIARRTNLSFMDAQAALQALPLVVDVMGAELGWDEKRRRKEWTETVNFLTTMGLPATMIGITRDEVVQGRIGQELVPMAARAKVSGTEPGQGQTETADLPLHAMDSGIAQ